ncbi:MAG: hypothetical protein KKC77_19460, partial [Proteobacteria bacterium]|nr:hypothetical protein [Pseudomonadota bacterium]
MTNPQALRKEHCSNCNNLISGTNGRPSQSGFCSNCSSLIRNGRRKSPTQPNYKQVRLMLENKFKQGHTQAIKEVLEIIEEMETLDIYFNKEMAIKTLILAGRVISG